MRTKKAVGTKLFGLLALILASVSYQSSAVAGASLPGGWKLVVFEKASTSNSEASGVCAGIVVGTCHDRSGNDRARIWKGITGHSVEIQPRGATSSDAIAVTTKAQGGVAEFSRPGEGHAGIWRGTSASWLDLHPSGARSSCVTAISGTSQVGYAEFRFDLHASLWNGTRSSWIDLNPKDAKSSSVLGTDGRTQVGEATFKTTDEYIIHAGMWHGTPASWVDLHPSGKASFSQANAVFGNTQVGQARFIGGRNHASLWHGNASSCVDLNPEGSGESCAYGVYGNIQVGYASFSHSLHAGLWKGTASTWVDLHPSGYTDSVAKAIYGSATGIWIVGWVTDRKLVRHAALWYRS